MAREQTNVGDLLPLLETSDLQQLEEIRGLINEQLSSGKMDSSDFHHLTTKSLILNSIFITSNYELMSGMTKVGASAATF